MTAPARQVLTLVRGMIEMDRIEAAAHETASPDADEDGTVSVSDPNRAARIMALAEMCGGEVA